VRNCYQRDASHATLHENKRKEKYGVQNQKKTFYLEKKKEMKIGYKETIYSALKCSK